MVIAVKLERNSKGCSIGDVHQAWQSYNDEIKANSGEQMKVYGCITIWLCFYDVSNKRYKLHDLVSFMFHQLLSRSL